MLSAGVSPSSSWGYLTGPGRPGDGMVDAVAEMVASGGDVPDALLSATERLAHDGVSQAWRGLAAAWAVATDAGAPLAPTLSVFADSLRAIARVQRDLAVALAAPTATARLVMILPVVAVGFGLALGFDTLSVLTTNPVGVGCLVAGIGLMLLARLWNRRLCAAAAPDDLSPGLELDLIAIAVSGGASTDRAVGAVGAAVARCSLEVADSGAVIADILELSRRAGIPAAELLRSEAEEARRAAASEGERRAAALGVSLMLPLGVCVLPAFMLLGVAPLLISVISSTVGRF